MTEFKWPSIDANGHLDLVDSDQGLYFALVDGYLVVDVWGTYVGIVSDGFLELISKAIATQRSFDSKYVQEHADALKDLIEAGAAVTFSQYHRTFDPLTNRSQLALIETIAGYAIEVPKNPEKYKELDLIVEDAPTLLFVPTNLGYLPELGGSCSWAGAGWNVRDISPLALDGPPIMARVVISGGVRTQASGGFGYSREHADALADISAAGEAVTFGSVSGFAIEVPGNPAKYTALSLIGDDAPTLLFVPTEQGYLPDLGEACTWAGSRWTARDITPLAIDGTPIMARIVISGGTRVSGVGGLSYSVEHADALREIKQAGAAITFSQNGTSVAGHAIRTRGNPKRYEALKLIEESSPTLLFAATTYGDVPRVGYTGTWNLEDFVIRDVRPVGPDGSPIMFKVVISK